MSRVTPPTWRRQFNKSFEGKDGSFEITKAIAVVGQLVALWHLNANFVPLIERWDSLLVVLTVIIAPDTIKKFVNMKYGSSNDNAEAKKEGA